MVGILGGQSWQSHGQLAHDGLRSVADRYEPYLQLIPKLHGTCFFSGIGLTDIMMVFSFNEYRKGRAFLSFISRCKRTGRFVFFLFNLTQCALNVALISLLSIGLFQGTGIQVDTSG